ncbi:MAG TPA: SDR family oxidoreductase [Mycobacteriales bacterium]
MSARHVLVTGAAGGIGLAVAEAFATRGDTVTGVDARGVELDAAMAGLAGGRGTAHALVADLSDERCGEIVAAAQRLAGPVDVLVNAAGIYPATRLDDMTAAQWDRVQHVNVRAPVLLTVAVARAGRPAAVVNISSGAATRARPGAAHYCTSKAALEMATKACAVEFADRGIRVNAVAPGFIEVDSPVNPVTDEYAAAVSVNPTGRPGRPDEIAAAVVWLAGAEAGFVTGAVLRVDGGASAGTSALPVHHPSITALQRAEA